MPRDPDVEMTGEEIERLVCGPLAMLSLEIKSQAKRIAQLAADGRIPSNKLLVNFEMANTAIKMLQRFRDKEMKLKLNGLEDGTYRWRSAEQLAEQRNKRGKQKDKSNPKKRAES